MKMPRSEFDQLIRNVISDADLAALDTLKLPGKTQADVIRAAVTASFRCAIGNDLLTPVPMANWPEYVHVSLKEEAVLE